MDTQNLSPLLYQQHLESPEIDEDATTLDLISILRRIAETVYKHSKHARRGVHAKAHALLVGQLKVFSDLPEVYRQGIFARENTYPVLMRFSTIAGDMLDDSISLPRGLGLKIIGVPGERLADFPEDVSQDFLFGNGPVFPAPTAKKFSESLDLFAKTTDYPQILKKSVAFIAKILNRIVAIFNGQCPLLSQLGGHPATHILSDTFFSQAPLLYGDFIAKLQLVPVTPELIASQDKEIDLTHPDSLRQAANDWLRDREAQWELRVQLCVDPVTMPIEDSSIEWPQDQSPYIPVGVISVKPQSAWNEERAKLDDSVSFHPWRGLLSHRPLGSIMRARRKVYTASVRYRTEANNIPIRDPKSFKDLPES